MRRRCAMCILCCSRGDKACITWSGLRHNRNHSPCRRQQPSIVLVTLRELPLLACRRAAQCVAVRAAAGRSVVASSPAPCGRVALCHGGLRHRWRALPGLALCSATCIGEHAASQQQLRLPAVPLHAAASRVAGSGVARERRFGLPCCSRSRASLAWRISLRKCFSLACS